jgi:hypothetical protein
MWFVENADPGRIGRITVAPGVTGPHASSVSESAATIGSTVGANAQATSFVVQYGTTTTFALKTAPGSAGSAGTPQPVSARVDGLDPGTTYHFRVVATNGAGTTSGPDGSFTTGGVAPPPPKAAQGKTVVAGVVSGRVMVRPPGSARFVALDGTDALPVGTTLDTRRGVVAVTSALPSGSTQSARFWAGVFQVRQARRGDGVVNIFLRGGPTKASCARTAHTNALEQATARRRAARLWGKDRHGRYHTHGGNSVAAVRGTTWLTEERCTGTFTRVTAGAVAVRDLRTHKEVMLRAGRSYLARRPG